MTETTPDAPRSDERLDPRRDPRIEVRLDDRLDAIDRALSGILPRSERLALIDEIERKLVAAVESGGDDARLRAAAPPVAVVESTRTAEATRAATAKCRPAFLSGVIGLSSCSLMIAAPVTYIVATMLLEVWGEAATIAVLVGHLALFTLGGAVASVLGVVGAVSLSMAGSRRTGRGWAAVGLCTGPMPLLIGALLLAAVGYSIQQGQATAVDYSPASIGSPYGASPVATPLPPPTSTAPTYGSPSPYSAVPAVQPWPSAPPAPASVPLYAPTPAPPSPPSAYVPLPPSPLPGAPAPPAPPVTPVAPPSPPLVTPPTSNGSLPESPAPSTKPATPPALPPASATSTPPALLSSPEAPELEST